MTPTPEPRTIEEAPTEHRAAAMIGRAWRWYAAEKGGPKAYPETCAVAPYTGCPAPPYRFLLPDALHVRPTLATVWALGYADAVNARRAVGLLETVWRQRCRYRTMREPGGVTTRDA